MPTVKETAVTVHILMDGVSALHLLVAEYQNENVSAYSGVLHFVV